MNDEYKRPLMRCVPFGSLGRFKMGCLLDDGLQATWTMTGLDISIHFLVWLNGYDLSIDVHLPSLNVGMHRLICI
jgi:hypothetical protein